MRLVVLACALGAVALMPALVPSGPAAADKTRMGCDRETEVWDATAGKCELGTPKWRRKAVEPPPPPEPVKAAKAKPKGKAKAKGTKTEPAKK